MKTIIKSHRIRYVVFTLYSAFLTLFIFLLGCAHTSKSVYRFAPTPVPDRITLNLTADPSHSIAVTWRTDTSVSNGIVQWTVADPGPDFESNATSVDAQSQLFTNNYENEPAF